MPPGRSVNPRDPREQIQSLGRGQPRAAEPPGLRLGVHHFEPAIERPDLGGRDGSLCLEGAEVVSASAVVELFEHFRSRREDNTSGSETIARTVPAEGSEATGVTAPVDLADD